MTLFWYHLPFDLKICMPIKCLLGARHLGGDLDSTITTITQAAPCPPLRQTPNLAAALASQESVRAYLCLF